MRSKFISPMISLRLSCTASMFLIYGFINCCSSQNKQTEIVSLLDQSISEVRYLEPDLSYDDLTAFKMSILGKRIVALGEATHGSPFIYKYRDRLTRFLIAELDFKAIAFEADYFHLEHLDNYVNGLTDTFKWEGVSGFPVGYHLELLEWIRGYNKGLPEDDRIHIYGLETRGIYNAVDAIGRNFKKLNENQLTFLDKFKKTLLSKISKKEINDLLDSIPKFREMIDESSVKSGIENHYLDLLEQFLENYQTKKYGSRDKYMASNVDWIYKRKGQQKIIVSAHNGHIAKDRLFNYTTLGSYLAETYEDRYYAAATDFNFGDVIIQQNINGSIKQQKSHIDEVKNRNSYEFYFAQAKFDNFFIDMHSLGTSEQLNTFFSNSKNMRLVGATVDNLDTNLNLMKCFDGLFFFDDISITNSN